MSKGIQSIFSSVPPTYELINHILTFGLDILWRRRAAHLAATDGGTLWLDICSGTGEMAVCLQRLTTENTKVIAADFSLPMLSKMIEKSEKDTIIFTMADASSLPFHDNSFDLVTISFATRNINVNIDTLHRCLQEFHRILKPGGRFVNLETSQPPIKLIKWISHTYVRLFVKPIGYLISGSKAPYAYLSRTIRSFYDADELADIICQAGFKEVTFRRMLLGAAAIHRAVK